ncbi:MAG: hypothetical protein K2X73_06170 [Sphingomonas sp.]|uniref:hypothetical protein n=1 Tax=Sphingomonas sp. TaxID=28214 RepID=UPI0025EE39F7|nr:hypothetical protein [Sphingomonas sp.]MBX9881544.1 hypothetical protein [Sphingomonas sp.]
MKLIVCAALFSLSAAPALAQQAPAPAPAPASGDAAAPATAGALTLDTPIETLVANPKAKAALDQVLQTDITANPFYDQIKAMSFNQVQPLSNGQLSDELLKKIGEALAAIK